MNRFLRSLSPEQQLSLLFVVLFGTLLLASSAVFLLSMRERPDTDPVRWRLKRVSNGLRRTWVMMGLIWLALALGKVGALWLFAVASLLGLREFVSLTPTRRADHKALLLAFFGVLPAQYLLMGTGHTDLFTVFVPVYVFLLVPLVSSLGDDPHRFLERNATVQWGIMVCVYGLSHVPALLFLQVPGTQGSSVFLVFWLVMVVQTAMVVQHVAGRSLRRPASLPHISDGFRWPACALGVLAGGVMGGMLAGLTPFKPGQGLAMGLIASGSGALGHLVMKAIKRDRGVPHWGALGRSVTGAVGLLDRVDALCFAAPVLYQSIHWYFRA
ncbi:MAG TPA: phosphatidate cytidylyltransferase [Burkholderiaceae bacterium]|nr:phosphatidate cytidylyltransferase [Burkholderiaceae bacterium]